MNKELLKKLEIDESLGLHDLVDALEAKQFEYLERAQSTPDDKRREEIEAILEEIEQEINTVKEEIRNAESSLISDDGTSEAPEETPAQETAAEEDATAAKVDAIKQREAERAEEQRAAAQQAAEQAAQQQDQGNGQDQTAHQQQVPPAAASLQPNDPLRQGLTAYHNQDYTTAFRIFTKLANEKPPEPIAQHMLAVMYHDGNGCPVDWDGFDFWSKHASDNGLLDASEYRACCLLTDAKDHPGKLVGKKAIKQELARYTEALELLEKAADGGMTYSMETYVKTIELRYLPSADPVASAIRSCIKRSHVKKAIEYCKTLSGKSADAYEAKQWEDRMKSLKRGRPYKGDKRARSGCGCLGRPLGCGGWLLIIFVVIPFSLMGISFVATAIQEYGSLGNAIKAIREDSSVSDTVIAEPDASVFGSDPIDLHDFPEDHIPESSGISSRASEYNSSYTYDFHGEAWNDAFLFRAGDVADTAYIDYQIDGAFETLRFRATPLRGYDLFFNSTVAALTVIDTDTGETLYDAQLTNNNELLEPEIDVTGRHRIRIAVTLVSNSSGFTLIKDAYLIPLGSGNTE